MGYYSDEHEVGQKSQRPISLADIVSEHVEEELYSDNETLELTLKTRTMTETTMESNTGGFLSPSEISVTRSQVSTATNTSGYYSDIHESELERNFQKLKTSENFD